MRLTNLYVYRNVVDNGYLPLESILSTIDICDEALICVDPDFPDDVELAGRLAQKFSKVRIIHFRWPQNAPGDGSRIGIASQYALDHASGDYCLNIQADEIYPIPLMVWLRDNWRFFASNGFECFRLKVLNLEHNAQKFQGGGNWDWQNGAGYNAAIKLFKHCPAIRFAHDGWSVDGCAILHHAQISNIYPVLHLHDHFRDTLIQLRQAAADEIWTDREKFGHYKASADNLESSKDSWWNDPEWVQTSSPFEYLMPDYVRSILGTARYIPRYELLDGF